MSEQREDDEKHLLIMPLMICHVAVWHRGEECLQQPQGTVDVVLADEHRHPGYRHITLLGIRAVEIVGQQTLEEPHLHLLVRQVEGV